MKKIIHIDMDAFFAAVEQRDNPDLKGKPVIVGGPPNSRGVVSACSYEARKFGVHSAMASSVAHRLCPRAVFIIPHMEAYIEVSRVVHAIFHRYTDLVEPLSIDEAYLDVTENLIHEISATKIAIQIKKDIFDETQLTASAGVSYNKFLAKVASDMNKPDGITVIKPEDATAFLEKLPVGKFFGVGRVTEKRMKQMGINTGGDLKELERAQLAGLFGKQGEYYYNIVRGVDFREVEPHRVRKSVGRERTFIKDIDDMSEIISIIHKLSEKVEEIMSKNELRGRTITLKLKYHDFTVISRSITLDIYTGDAAVLADMGSQLLEKTEAGKKKIRLIGLSVSNLENEDADDSDQQMSLPF